MIAEWLYEVTCWIGGCLGNALGFPRSPHEDAISGILFLWFMLTMTLLLLICFVILYGIEAKENEELK